MNKDKIIKDLKKRNDSLKMQYEYRNIRCICLENENKRLLEENEQLKDKINGLTSIGQTIFTGKNYNDLALENEQLKKQKDDVVNFIHKELDRFDCEGSMSISMRISYFKEDLLRMLGETDEFE